MKTSIGAYVYRPSPHFLKVLSEKLLTALTLSGRAAKARPSQRRHTVVPFWDVFEISNQETMVMMVCIATAAAETR
jgi:hypothetical protein